jgi:hypothetical protein
MLLFIIVIFSCFSLLTQQFFQPKAHHHHHHHHHHHRSGIDSSSLSALVIVGDSGTVGIGKPKDESSDEGPPDSDGPQEPSNANDTKGGGDESDSATKRSDEGNDYD